MIAAVLCCAMWASVQEPQPVFRVRTRVVEVTVQASRRDGSVAGDLTASDLRLFDNNREQTITSFESVPALAADAAVKANGRSVSAGHTRRLSILLLDAVNTEWSDQLYARKAAARLLSELPAGERIAIFVLGESRLRLLHDFSSDAASLTARLRRFSGELPGDHVESALNPLSAEFSYSDFVGSRTPSSGPWVEFKQRQRIRTTLEALATIARLVRNASGQKNLLWLSAGFPMTLAAYRSMGAESFYTDMLGAARELNAANVTIYPIDARGLSISSRAYINIGTMQELAAQTGGKAFYDSNDLAGMVGAALADSRQSYLLAYTPSPHEDDGKFHTIRLRVSRPGVRLRYRPGYYADPPERRKR